MIWEYETEENRPDKTDIEVKGEAMKGLIGFWLIGAAITIMIVCITDLDFIEMIKMVLLFTVFLAMLCIGSYLLVGS